MQWIAELFIEQSLGFYFGLILMGIMYTPILQRREHFLLRFFSGTLIGLVIVYLVPEYRLVSVAPSTKTLTIYAFFILLVLFCFRGSFKDFLFADISALTSQHLSLCVTEVFTISFGITDPTLYALFSILGGILTYFAVYFVFARKLKNANNVSGMDYTLILVAVFLFLIIFLAQRVVTTYETITASFRFFDGLTCFLGLFILFIQLGKTNEAWEKRMLQELMESERKRYVLLEQSMDAINRKAHDLKYAEKAWRARDSEAPSDRDMQDEYIAEFDYIAQTGFPPLDNILTEKGILCEKNSIQFTYIVDGEKLHFMQFVDVAVLFGNAIDNAIECVLKYPDLNKRIISLNATEKEGAVRIRIENYCEDELEFVGGLPMSRKQDKQNHGFGLKSIRYIVEKYHGMLAVNYQGRLFTINMSIPIKNQ